VTRSQAGALAQVEAQSLAISLQGSFEYAVQAEVARKFRFFQADGSVLLEDVSGGEEATGALRGVVRDAAGAPVPGALVQVGPERDRRSPFATRTADDGSFALDNVPAGAMQLRAGGGDHGLAHAPIEVVPGQEVAWEGRLDRGVELTGTLVDGRGAPLAGWHVEALAHGAAEPWIDGAVAGEDGRFAIPNVMHCPYALRVRPPDGALFAWRIEGVWPGAEQRLVVRGAELGRGAVRLQPVRPDGQPAAGIELRLWLDAVGEGVRSSSSSGDARQIDHLGPGLYTIAAGGPGLAHLDVAQVQVAAGAPSELGALAVAEPARLSLPEGLEVGERTFALLRLHDAVPSRAGALGADNRELVLPPGRYLVHDGENTRELEVKPGANAFEPGRRERAGVDTAEPEKR
jgi:hypothetical protein